jgi:long-chain fatty acid transport protein
MTRLLPIFGALALSTSAALAGGVERSAQSVALLFEPGRYAEFNLSAVRPSVSGTFFPTGANSGDVVRSYTSLSFGYKMPLNDRMDFAVIVDEPIGADTFYPASAYPIAGSFGKVDSAALTGILRYRMNENVSVYGGLRLQQAKGRVGIESPMLPGSYTAETNTDRRLGFLVGAAYERPEIAMRVALTYNSRITHKFDSTETLGGVTVAEAGFNTSVPESLNLEFQTGIAADTLLFGNVRWQRWTKFDISPPFYTQTLGQPALVSYPRNTTTINLGVGRRINENWSVAGTLGYEKGHRFETTNLGPTNGQRSIGVAATYTQDNVRVTAGLRYIDIGDARPRIGNAAFRNNHAIAAGIRVGMSF